MQKCGNYSTACLYTLEGINIQKKIIKEARRKSTNKITCNIFNIIYMLEFNTDSCKKKQYIGESKRLFKNRLANHQGYIVNHNVDKAMGAHCNQPGHPLANL